MKKYLTSLPLFFVVAVSCSRNVALEQTRNKNLQQMESKIFALRPEKELPKDNLPSERLKLELNNRTLFANWVSAGNNAPAFFILHGNGETLSDWRALQAYLLSKGYSSLVFDYTGFGSSTGIPTVATVNEDAVEAYKRFATLTVNAKQRIAFAHSLGCSMLLENVNKFIPMPDKVVTHAGFSTLREIGVEKKLLTDSSKIFYPDAWNGYRNIKKIKQPLYIIHSKKDKTIPIWMGEALAKSGGSNVKLLKLENSGHNAVYEDPTDHTWNNIFAFINSEK
jgi:pimeloyl-ACP methyl ester carboxylesterase